ncbi:hypothetical protein ACLKA6_002147 [Drosophila palustris]
MRLYSGGPALSSLLVGPTYGDRQKFLEYCIPSIFQAEIHAIEVCAIECIRRRMQGATIFILSDSQAALKALQSFNITSKRVDNCLRQLDRLGKRNTLTVGWIPGHEGHAGNEIADHGGHKELGREEA